ncbi:PAS domain-containing protein [Mucilaginibacter sp. HMF5004]|uniref:PAS domain-containing protein n=1 Tax=Mucilaginibacter rivuli TaxID=2857527 RepID=UPI001C5FA5BC|nr:PAS domain-containing protein [Mucilaginibacter rivuli]MBW4890027.1 PAS domain-containing protein [Mucilaginibacter rivuli]
MKLFHRFYDLWLRIIGNREEFPLEFRIYHAVLVITALALSYNIWFKYHIGSTEGSILAFTFLFINIYLLYISRINRQLGGNVLLFSIAGNCLVISHFFISSGINGPTLIYSATHVLLVIAISPARRQRLLVIVNFLVVAVLLFFQFQYPRLFVSYYQNQADRYIDTGSGYFFVTAIIYFTIRYTRKNYAFEKISAEENARSIIEHQEFILNQNIELANLNERFEYVTKATFDAIWDWDITKNELYWGKGYETIFGYPAESGEVSQNFSLWQNRVHHNDAERVIATLSTAMENPERQFWQEQYQYLKADGSYAYVMDRGYMIRDADHKAIRIVGALQDITSLKAQEIKILEQNKRLQQIADINSHELRKPVATILGLIQLIEPGEIKDELHRQLFEYIKLTTLDLDAVIKKVADSTNESAG